MTMYVAIVYLFTFLNSVYSFGAEAGRAYWPWVLPHMYSVRVVLCYVVLCYVVLSHERVTCSCVALGLMTWRAL